MSEQRVGRNEPCPCGSGKKYKKCCIDNFTVSDELIIPHELSGTKLAKYLGLFDLIAQYGAVLMKNDETRDVLMGSYEEFERTYKPGKKDGLYESFFMNWFFLDFRFGTYQRTIAEKFLETKLYKDINKEDKALFTHLANSYAMCYEVKEVQTEYIIFEELITKKIWKMMTTGEPYQEKANVSDIWHMRLVGTEDSAWAFGDPYMFKKEAKNDFEQIILINLDSFKEYMKTRSLIFEPFRDGCKAAMMIWAEYLYRSNPNNRNKKSIFTKPHVEQTIVTTDREKIRFCSVYFRIIKKEGLNEKLNKLSGLEYDEQNNGWIWFREGNKTIKSAGNTVLGWIKIQHEYVLAEVNSLERGLFLKDKFIKELGDFLEYERIDGKDLASMPPLSEEKKQKFEEEQKKLFSNPEIAQFMRQKLEDYYLKEWIVTKIPALDDKTPVQTAKTKEGRLKLEALINSMEMRIDAVPNQSQFDMNLLRIKLGLANT